MIKAIFSIFFFLQILFLTSCLTSNSIGGTEVGNPDSIVVSGDVSSSSTSSSTAFLRQQNSGQSNCLSDTVFALDSSGNETQSSVDENCNFRMSLTSGAGYEFYFTFEEEFVASMFFVVNSENDESNTVVLSGNEDFDLGLISFASGRCSPQNDPYRTNDRDGDGIFDFDDDDDDDDGIFDILEEDCDFDGFFDDFDDEDACEFVEADENEESVLDVFPRDDSDFEDNDKLVRLTDDVRFRVSCRIDTDTITSENIRIVSGSDEIACDFSTNSSQNRIECEHDNDPFLPDSIYTVTIENLRCDNGNSIENAEWSFVTGDFE